MTCNPSMVRPAGAAALASVRAASLRGRHRLRAPPGVPAHARRADVHMPLHVPHRGGKHVPRDVGALPADAGARRRWHTMNLETPLRSPCLPAHFHLACLRISTSVAQWAPPLSAYLRLSPPISAYLAGQAAAARVHLGPRVRLSCQPGRSSGAHGHHLSPRAI